MTWTTPAGPRRRTWPLAASATAVTAVVAVAYAASSPDASDERAGVTVAANATDERAPELGEADTPAAIRDLFERGRARARDGSPAADRRGNVLAKHRAGDGRTLVFMGQRGRAEGERCDAIYLEGTEGGSATCATRVIEVEGISVMRGALPGPTETIAGTAPAGTRKIVLSGAGHRLEVAAYRSGADRGGRAYFVAPWPNAADTTVTALNARGDVLATASDPAFRP